MLALAFRLRSSLEQELRVASVLLRHGVQFPLWGPANRDLSHGPPLLPPLGFRGRGVCPLRLSASLPHVCSVPGASLGMKCQGTGSAGTSLREAGTQVLGCL